jgi:(4-(4-[2-(gamma-L-glutamylamino)ethyl]phenoxymethyl)furan-2-yl)methanamine synthase
MSADAIGLDIGGANLKAATSAGRSLSRPFALWKHPERLADELAAIAAELRPTGPVAVTMTGELCDCFETKRDGVRHILAAVGRAFRPERTRVWSTAGRFVALEEGAERPLQVAAANWHAEATYVGRFGPAGFALLIDTGSTTTDVIPLRDGRPAPRGRTDPERLRSGELIYTGVRRTPVCAVLGPTVMAELFATMHDVYVHLQQLSEEPDNRDTADGRPMTVRQAHARLSRMLGGDPEITPEAETLTLARTARRLQVATIARSVIRLCARELPGTLVVSGSGEFLARAALQSIGWNDETPRVVALSDRLGPDLSVAACAYAVAKLAAEANG